ncbi:MAG: hypothetical protein ABI444_12790 [Candidatus Kapaibacterium sp.]|jgi:hypothetical protein
MYNLSPEMQASLPGARNLNSTLGTDRYVIDGIHQAEAGRRTWLIVAMTVLSTVAAFVIAAT